MTSVNNVGIKMDVFMKWINRKTTCWQTIFIIWCLIDKANGLSV